MTHSSYLLASPTDGFAKAQLMSQCLPYHPTDLSPYLPYLPYQRLKPCSTCQALRSEEHTSELQSLMRNSYAVFCLKKQKTLQYPTQRSKPLTHQTAALDVSPARLHIN